MLAANYYFYDALSSIKSVLQSELHFSNTDYGLIVSFYSLLNVVMVMVGGTILDKWGIRKTAFVFLGISTLGAFITAYGASEYYNKGGFAYQLMSSFLTNYSSPLKMMMLGRLFFGIGAETIIVVVNKILVKWYKGKEIAFAFGLNISVARLGTTIALIYSPISIGSPILINGVLHYTGFPTATWLAAMLVGISLLLILIHNFCDKIYDRQTHKHNTLEISPEEEFHFSDVLRLFKNKSFIYISMLSVLFYSAVFPFLGYAPDLLLNKFGLDLQTTGMMQGIISVLKSCFGQIDNYRVSLIISGLVASLVPLGTIFFTPLAGIYVDRKGKSASLMIWGSVILILVHLILALTTLTPYIPIFMLGIAFSLVPAAMWPAVARIIDEKSLGTAYGVMTSIQNLGLFVFPVLIGKVLDFTNNGITSEMISQGSAKLNYTPSLLIFAALGLGGLLFAFLLKREDKVSGYGLELPSENNENL